MPDARAFFDLWRNDLQRIYGDLDWEQKSALLRALIEAGDHPPGFSVAFDIERLSVAERQYLRDIGVGPFPDEETTDAR